MLPHEKQTHVRKSVVNFLWLMYHSLLECLSTLITCKVNPPTTKPNLYLYHIQEQIWLYTNKTNSIYNYFSSASYYHFMRQPTIYVCCCSLITVYQIPSKVEMKIIDLQTFDATLPLSKRRLTFKIM